MRTKIILFAALFLAILGCDKKKLENPPKDFDVIFSESDFGQMELIKGKLIRRVNGADYKINLFLTQEEKLTIYNSILANGLLDLPKNYHPKPDCEDLHHFFYEMKIFANNKVHHLHVSDCDYGFFENFKVKKCIDSIYLIITIVEKREEVKEIPKSGGIRL